MGKIQQQTKLQWLKSIKNDSFLKGSFAVLFIVLGVITFLYFTRSTETIEVRLFLTEREWSKTWENYPDNFFMEQLEPGMVEKDELGSVEAEVLDITSNRLPYTHNIALGTFRLKANYNKRTNVYSFQGKPLIIGDYQRLRIGGVRVQGYVMDVAQHIKPIEEKKVFITVSIEDILESDRNIQNSRSNGILKETADALSIGQTIENLSGEAVLEITELELTPATRTFFTPTGQFDQLDYSLRAGTMTVEATVHSINDVDYWNFTEPLQVGRRITFPFEHAAVPVRIIEVRDVSEEIHTSQN